MKTVKLSFDFSDKPALAQTLRIEAAKAGTSQKAILVEALESYFSNKFENSLLLAAADKTFAEWENSEDAVYDTL